MPRPPGSLHLPPTKISSPSRKNADPDIPIQKEAKAEYARAL